MRVIPCARTAALAFQGPVPGKLRVTFPHPPATSRHGGRTKLAGLSDTSFQFLGAGWAPGGVWNHGIPFLGARVTGRPSCPGRPPTSALTPHRQVPRAE